MKIKFKYFLIFFIFIFKLNSSNNSTSTVTLTGFRETLAKQPGTYGKDYIGKNISYLIQLYGMYKTSNYILNMINYKKNKNKKFSDNPLNNTLRIFSQVGIIYLLSFFAPYTQDEIDKLWPNIFAIGSLPSAKVKRP